MNTEDKIESLDNINNAPINNGDQNGIPLGSSDQIAPVSEPPIAATPLESNAPIDLMAPSPGMGTPDNVPSPSNPVEAPEISTDTVAPTNLESTNINSFGQEGIPIDNINQNPKPSSLQTVTKSDEYNNIGTVPPNAHIEQKQKKPLNKKVLFLVILLVIGVGVGLFLYLRLGNSAEKIKVKDLKIQVSDKISTNLNDYVASGKLDSSCVANFDEVVVSEIGTYNYKIICNSGTYTGKIQVVDETAPQVTTRLVFRTIGADIEAKDFIEDCKDGSGCTYAFSDESTVKEYLNTAGSYEVSISVKDNYNNEKIVLANLIVTETEITVNMVCESKNIETEEGYTYSIKDSLGLANGSEGLAYAGFTMRDLVIKYNDSETYEKAKATIKDGIIDHSLGKGKATTNDDDKQITINKFLSEEERNTEFEDSSTDYPTIRNGYENDDRGFECVTTHIEE